MSFCATQWMLCKSPVYLDQSEFHLFPYLEGISFLCWLFLTLKILLCSLHNLIFSVSHLCAYFFHSVTLSYLEHIFTAKNMSEFSVVIEYFSSLSFFFKCTLMIVTDWTGKHRQPHSSIKSLEAI